VIGSLITLSARTQRCHSQHGGAEDHAHHSGAARWTNLRSHKKGHNKTANIHKKHVLTLTSANGKEFYGHAKINEILSSGFYFCTPYHGWERGLNENTNGLVRQYFRKGTDVAKLTVADVLRIENLLNKRPRKALNYHSPNEVFAKLTASPENYALGI